MSTLTAIDSLNADLVNLRVLIDRSETVEEANAFYRQARIRYYADSDLGNATAHSKRLWWEVTEALCRKIDQGDPQ